MSDEIQEIDDTITVPELTTITTIQADDALMLTHGNGVTEKIAAQNITNRDTFIISATPTLTGPILGTGFAIRVLFTAALTGLNASSPLVINYNGTDYTVKVAKDGALVNFVAKEFTENNNTVYKYLQAYTVLELIYNGTNLVIVGNPLVHSSADYKMYADGSEELSVVDEVTADNMHSVTSNAVYKATLKVDMDTYYGAYGSVIECRRCGNVVDIHIYGITNSTVGQDMNILQAGVMAEKYRPNSTILARGNTKSSNWENNTNIGIKLSSDGSIATYSYSEFANGSVRFSFIKN